MAKGQGRSSEQGVKLLYIRDYLRKYTDKEHPKNAKDIIEYLAFKGIKAERKTIYNDIYRLRMDFREPIEYNHKKWGYYISEPQFTRAELALLIDCIRYSPFMTEDDALTLMSKVKGLANNYDLPTLAQHMKREDNKLHTDSSVLQNLQILSRAIDQKRKISFRKIRYVADRAVHTEIESERTIASPYELTWAEGRYILKYSIDYYADDKIDEEYVEYLKESYGDDWEQYYPDTSDDDDIDNEPIHCECDAALLADIQITSMPSTHSHGDKDEAKRREAVEEMFYGPMRAITIRFCKDVIDRVAFELGRDAVFIPVDKYHFETTIRHRVDDRFCSWISSYGCHAKILSPQDAIDMLLGINEDAMHNLKVMYKHDLEPIDILTGDEFESLSPEEYELLRPDTHAKIQIILEKDTNTLSVKVKKDNQEETKG